MTTMRVIRAHLVLVERHKARAPYLHCVLSWDQLAPLDVELLFPGPERVTWRFARGVLADGLTVRTWGSAGDVMVEPLPGGDLLVRLHGFFPDLADPNGEGEDGEVDYVTSRSLVARFVRETHEVVPLGGEPLPVSANQLLAELLGGRS